MTDSVVSVLDLEYQERRVEEAAAALERKRASLLRPSGERIYSDDEHTRREAAFLAEFMPAAESAIQAADKALQDAERVASAAGADPTTWLSPAQLTEATARWAFIKEEADAAPLGRLLDRVRAASNSGTVDQWLWHRAGRARLEAMMSLPANEQPRGAKDVHVWSELSRALDALQEAVTPAHIKTARARGQELQQRGVAVGMKARSALAEADGSAERNRQQFRQWVRNIF